MSGKANDRSKKQWAKPEVKRIVPVRNTSGSVNIFTNSERGVIYVAS